MITGLQVQNVRSLVDTGSIQLRKINVLVGKNSSGKSTFLRLFPLLRQSVEVRTKGPLLWYGRLVDFGSFAEAKTTGRQSGKMQLTFDLAVRRATLKRPKRIVEEFGLAYKSPRSIQLQLVLGLDELDSVGHVSEITIIIGGDQVTLTLRESSVISIKINDKDYAPGERDFWYIYLEGLVPSLSFYSEHVDSSGKKLFASNSRYAIQQIVSKLHHLAHGNTSKETLEVIAKQLQYAQREEFHKQLQNLPSIPLSLKTRLSGSGPESTYLENIRALVLLATLPTILRDADSSLGDFAKGVRYIEPVRASVERYYRLQDLAVDEIDSRGANTAMLLTSLGDHEHEALRKWMDEHLGFHAYIERSLGHVAIKIQIRGDVSGRNIADLGFGYSQVLPIVLQLWFSCIRRTHYRGANTAASLIAIEQPELHLHPSYQSLLADVFCAVSRPLTDGRASVPLLIETHSEHLVNRLGSLIAGGVIRTTDVQILLFEQEAGVTVLRAVSFDNEGILPECWPIGFFLPEA